LKNISPSCFDKETQSFSVPFPLDFHTNQTKSIVTSARFVPCPLGAISRTNKFSLNGLNSINLWLQITNHIKLNSDASFAKLKSDTKLQESASTGGNQHTYILKSNDPVCFRPQACWPVWKIILASPLKVFSFSIN